MPRDINNLCGQCPFRSVTSDIAKLIDLILKPGLSHIDQQHIELAVKIRTILKGGTV